MLARSPTTAINKATQKGRFFCLKQNNKLKLQIGKEVNIFQKPLISFYI